MIPFFATADKNKLAYGKGINIKRMMMLDRKMPLSLYTDILALKKVIQLVNGRPVKGDNRDINSTEAGPIIGFLDNFMNRCNPHTIRKVAELLLDTETMFKDVFTPTLRFTKYKRNFHVIVDQSDSDEEDIHLYAGSMPIH